MFGVFYTPQTIHGVVETHADIQQQSLQLPDYQDVYQQWIEDGYDEINYRQTIYPELFTFETSTLTTRDDVLVLSWNTFDTLSVDVFVENEGLYGLSLDYVSTTSSIKPIKVSVRVNDDLQYIEASRFSLPTLWSQNEDIAKDRFGNDIVPTSYQLYERQTFLFHDNVGLYDKPLLFYLEQGTNTLDFELLDGTLDVFDISFKPYEEIMSYDHYLEMYNDAFGNDFIAVEAEQMTYKNSPSIRSGNHRDPRVTPFALMESRLNILDGSTFSDGNQAVYYTFDVLDAGYYHITLKALQNGAVNTNIYRTLTVNGQIPFEEAKAISMPYSRQFQHITLSHDEKPLNIYLEQGMNTIGLHVDVSVVRSIYLGILDLMTRMNQTTLDVQKITGNQLDESRDWDLREYMPHLDSELDQYVLDIKALYDGWTDLHGTGASPVTTALRIAYERMQQVAKDPNDLPKNLNDFTVGSGSVLALIGNALPQLVESPLSIDILYIHDVDQDLPELRAGFFERLWIGIQRFFLSFFSEQYADDAADDEVDVWVNRGRAYVDLMQQMADAMYTPTSGQKVRVSLMPDENKLILANAAGAQPDLAMGIAAWRPFEFAVREALYDLRQFDNFHDVASRFESGTFTGLIYQDGVYALPETQNFQLLFYRRDVLETLNLDIPNTWYDVMDMLPELQRFGMNFYIPLANNAAFKSFDTTFPWIAQFGGSLYQEDGFSVAFDDPKTIQALDMMTKLFKIYAMPVEVGSFYQRFRYGDLPIGIGDFGMYVQLLHAAPEIAGLWDIALIPGVEDPVTNAVNRSFVGASTVNVIFEASSKKDEAWDFLTWWSEAETQIHYAESLITTYGQEFLWNTANLDAFLGMSWDPFHQQVIYEQWSHIYDPVKVPGSYMVERELSNIWNKVVYDGVNLRTAIEDGTVIANREITRKMIEFGYLNTSGVILNNYFIPTNTTIDAWRDEDA